MPYQAHLVLKTGPRFRLILRWKRLILERTTWLCYALLPATGLRGGFYGGALPSGSHSVIAGLERRGSEGAGQVDAPGLPRVASCCQALHGLATARPHPSNHSAGE